MQKEIREIVELLRLKCRVDYSIYGAIGRLYKKYGDKVWEAVDKLPMGHPKPLGYIQLYCEKPKAKKDIPGFFN